jgi:cold-inducible RNA-binding protein
MRLFVNNFPWATTEHDLTEIFSEFGPINQCHIATDRETGRSRGFAFIEYEDRDDGIEAMEQLDGTKMGGRQIRVVEARERTYSAGR